VKLLRTIRLDPSDGFVFRVAAAPGDWAICGTFLFADTDLATLAGKDLAAFRSGFLGVPSLGWSTLAQVVEADDADRQAAIAAATQCFLERLGAPDRAAAAQAATEEIDFAASLCDHPADTLIALHRRDESGTIRESFRHLRPRPDAPPRRVFGFLDASEDDAPGEPVDLARLARGDPA
jgi:hypothetical protein